DARERDQDVRVGGGGCGDLLVRNGAAPGDGLGVDGEDDRRHVALAVVGGDVVGGRGAAALEVRGGGLAPFRGQSVLAVSADLRVRVHVDRDDGVDVDGHGRSSNEGSCGSATATSNGTCAAAANASASWKRRATIWMPFGSATDGRLSRLTHTMLRMWSKRSRVWATDREWAKSRGGAGMRATGATISGCSSMNAATACVTARRSA